MTIKKDLLRLVDKIIENGEWDFIDREYPKKEDRDRVQHIIEEIDRGNVGSTENMVRLYEEGVTCDELGRLMGRAFQSIYRSIQNYGGEYTGAKHRESRKEWVRLIKRYEVVHLSDREGSYKRLVSKYGVTEARAREMYKKEGGKILILRENRDKRNIDEEIGMLYEDGYTGVEIAKVIGMPVSTVYYRLKKLKKEDE